MKNVLIPTDLTYCTLNTMKYAISLCSKSNTHLFFYHATTSGSESDELQAQHLISSAFRDLNYFIDETWFKLVIEDSPFTNAGIRAFVEAHEIDLVIMGTSQQEHKLTFYESHLSELIHELSCPVLTIPHGYKELSIAKIGYATELHDLSERLREIIPFARLFNAAIDAFHVYPVSPEILNVKRFETNAILSGIKKENQYDDITLQFIKTPFKNEMYKGIRKYLKTYKPDILVMCYKPKGLYDKFLLESDAVKDLVESSPIPILALNRKTACKIM
jgi:nucleotide-binding universal stress UspA family protein